MKKVLVLSASDGHNDSRVFKQVKALKNNGFDVEMISRATEKFPETHVHQGVTIHRLDVFAKSLPSQKSIEMAGQLLSSSPIEGKVKDYLTIYKSLHSSLAKLDDCVATIKKVRPKFDSGSQLLRELRENRSKNPFKFIACKLRAFCLRPSVTVDRRKLVRAQRGRDQHRAILEKYEGEVKANISDINFFLRPFWTYQVIAKAFNVDFFKKFDVIHVHDIFPLVAGYALAKEAGARLIYDAHEIEPERVPPLPDDRKNFVIALENSILPYTSKLITVGHECENYYQNNYKLNSSGVIFNSPITKVVSEPRDIKQELGFDEGKKVLLYVGAVGSAGRGLDKVIAALPMLSEDICLVVLGPRHKINDAKIKRNAVELNVAHRLILLPPVNHEILVAYIESADVGVCPIQDISLSYRYSMPNKLFEMAFAGIPICCSALPEMQKFVESHRIGKAFNEKDPASIAATVKQVLANRERYSLDGPSITSLKNKYSWEAQESNLVNFYNEVFEVDNPFQVT